MWKNDIEWLKESNNLKDQITKLETERDLWKNTLIDAVMAAEIYKQEHETNPRKALHDLICWQNSVAIYFDKKKS